MNFERIKQISKGALNIGRFETEALVKLSDSGCAFLLNLAGGPKLDTAAIAVLDTLIKINKPNILIVCPECRMFEWYSGMMTRLGLEFKYIATDTINFISNTTANLLIAGENTPLPDYRADLMIIDSAEPLRTASDYEQMDLKIKTAGSTLIFALSLNFDTDPSVIFNDISNVNIKTLKYKDNQSGEETRLSLLLSELSGLSDDPYGCSVIYFNEKKTIDTVYTAIKGTFKYLSVKRVIGAFADSAGLYNYLNGGFDRPPKIILAKDDIISGFSFAPLITHIFNYEETFDMYKLLARFIRRGEDFKHSPIFYFFENEMQPSTMGEQFKNTVNTMRVNIRPKNFINNPLRTAFEEIRASDCIEIVKTFYEWRSACENQPISYKQFLENWSG